MFKIEDETAESALCVGMVAALIWGIGLSLYVFQFGSDEISWVQWSAQLVGGILACLIVPLAWVRGAAWVTARLRLGTGQPQE